MEADTPIGVEAPAETAAWVAMVDDHRLTVDVPPGPAYLVDGFQERSTLVARDVERTPGVPALARRLHRTSEVSETTPLPCRKQ